MPARPRLGLLNGDLAVLVDVLNNESVEESFDRKVWRNDDAAVAEYGACLGHGIDHAGNQGAAFPAGAAVHVSGDVKHDLLEDEGLPENPTLVIGVVRVGSRVHALPRRVRELAGVAPPLESLILVGAHRAFLSGRCRRALVHKAGEACRVSRAHRPRRSVVEERRQLGATISRSSRRCRGRARGACVTSDVGGRRVDRAERAGAGAAECGRCQEGRVESRARLQHRRVRKRRRDDQWKTRRGVEVGEDLIRRCHVADGEHVREPQRRLLESGHHCNELTERRAIAVAARRRAAQASGLGAEPRR